MMAGEGRFKASAAVQKVLEGSLDDEGKTGFQVEKKAA
jgi:hypothetical protein